MALTLTAAETRVAQYLDDVADAVAATADIAAALAVEFPVVYKMAARAQPAKFAKETSITTTSAGVGDLTSLAPERILAVNYFSGSTRIPIPESSLADGPENALVSLTLKLHYLPGLTFPASGSTNFVWGQSSIDLPELDDLLCLRAASRLCVFLDEDNSQLEKLIARTERDLERISEPGAGWRIMPLRGRSRDSGYGWVKTDHVTLQLVIARASSSLATVG